MPAVIWPVSGGSRSRIPGRIRECQSWGRTGEGGLQNYGAKMCILAGSSAHSKLQGPHRSRLPHPRCSEGLVLAYGGPRGRPGGSPRPTPTPAWKTRLASSLSWCFSWLPGCSFPLSVTSSPFSACTFVGFWGGASSASTLPGSTCPLLPTSGRRAGGERSPRSQRNDQGISAGGRFLLLGEVLFCSWVCFLFPSGYLYRGDSSVDRNIFIFLEY